jgi:hypothetical protein
MRRLLLLFCSVCSINERKLIFMLLIKKWNWFRNFKLRLQLQIVFINKRKTRTMSTMTIRKHKLFRKYTVPLSRILCPLIHWIMYPNLDFSVSVIWHALRDRQYTTPNCTCIQNDEHTIDDHNQIGRAWMSKHKLAVQVSRTLENCKHREQHTILLGIHIPQFGLCSLHL